MITILETIVFNFSASRASGNFFNFFRSAEGRFFERSESEELPQKYVFNSQSLLETIVFNSFNSFNSFNFPQKINFPQASGAFKSLI